MFIHSDSVACWHLNHQEFNGTIVYSTIPKQSDFNEEAKGTYLGVTKRSDSTKV